MTQNEESNAVQRLMQVVLRRLDVAPGRGAARRLAQRLGYVDLDDERKTNRLLAGDPADPRVSTVMPVLIAAGLLDDEAARAWEGRRLTDVSQSEQAEDDALASADETVADAFQAIREEKQPQQDAPVAPSRTTRGRARRRAS